MCVHLSSEERRSLRELVDIREDHESVRKFIDRRLYDELSHLDGQDELGEELRTYKTGYHEQRQVYISLFDKGLLSASRPAPNVYWFGDLTPEGRCYFADEAARDEKEAEKTRSDRLHDWRIALFGVIGGLFSGALASFLLDIIRESTGLW